MGVKSRVSVTVSLSLTKKSLNPHNCLCVSLFYPAGIQLLAPVQLLLLQPVFISSCLASRSTAHVHVNIHSHRKTCQVRRGRVQTFIAVTCK